MYIDNFIIIITFFTPGSKDPGGLKLTIKTAELEWLYVTIFLNRKRLAKKNGVKTLLSSQTDESKGTKWDLASQAGVAKKNGVKTLKEHTDLQE